MRVEVPGTPCAVVFERTSPFVPWRMHVHGKDSTSEFMLAPASSRRTFKVHVHQNHCDDGFVEYKISLNHLFGKYRLDKLKDGCNIFDDMCADAETVHRSAAVSTRSFRDGVLAVREKHTSVNEPVADFYRLSMLSVPNMVPVRDVPFVGLQFFVAHNSTAGAFVVSMQPACFYTHEQLAAVSRAKKIAHYTVHLSPFRSVKVPASPDAWLSLESPVCTVYRPPEQITVQKEGQAIDKAMYISDPAPKPGIYYHDIGARDALLAIKSVRTVQDSTISYTLSFQMRRKQK